MNNTSWDKRSWLLAFVACACIGIIFTLRQQPFMQQIIKHASPINLYGTSVSVDTVASTLFAVTALVVFPIILSATARRLYLFWGLIPGVFCCVWAMGRDAFKHDAEQWHSDELAWVFIPVLSLLLTCGPISLYRWMQTRKRERLLALHQAMQDAANAPQEGVWPPPPRRPTP